MLAYFRRLCSQLLREGWPDLPTIQGSSINGGPDVTPEISVKNVHAIRCIVLLALWCGHLFFFSGGHYAWKYPFGRIDCDAEQNIVHLI